ncbi:MBL fold metallo-hydrolase [Betaproteobacteria bacterium SCN2]|nr:MBL fold metallo-hydrolase [Betaproteobacteria bacterium SCN2]
MNKLYFYGHNCFVAESDAALLVIDPWLTPQGAFFGSWHQYPDNSHLRQPLVEKAAAKDTWVYLTHEHRDHYGPGNTGHARGRTALSRLLHPQVPRFLPARAPRSLRQAGDGSGRQRQPGGVRRHIHPGIRERRRRQSRQCGAGDDARIHPAQPERLQDFRPPADGGIAEDQLLQRAVLRRDLASGLLSHARGRQAAHL